MSKIILDLYGGTGAWSKPYKDNGYDVRVITLPDYDIRRFTANGKRFYFTNGKDKGMFVDIDKVYGILAAPPCTHFSLARNDTTAKEPRDLRGSMALVNSCLQVIHESIYLNFRKNSGGLRFWALENPYSGYLKRFIGMPYLIFDPFEYGDPYTKKTALWGEFNVPKKNIVEPRNFEHPTTKGAKDFVSCVEHFADLKDIPEGYKKKTGLSNSKIMRSMTPQGFALSFYEANR